MTTRVARDLARRSVMAWMFCTATAAAAVATPTLADCGTGASQARLQVKVSGLANTKGNVTITIYPDDPDQFLAKRGKIARQRVPATAPLTEACFALPSAGGYAVAVYHDANGDHDFNRRLTGLPAEGYGFSNNPVTRLGLPSLKEVRFAATTGDNPVYIKLTY